MNEKPKIGGQNIIFYVHILGEILLYNGIIIEHIALWQMIAQVPSALKVCEMICDNYLIES